MYNLSLLLHSYTRWLVVVLMVLAVGRAWWGVWRGSPWTRTDRLLGLAFGMAMSVQFLWGVALYFVPDGLAQAAVRDMGAAMKVRELRFFGLEHPLQMVIALALVHIGSARARRAATDRARFRWSAWAFTVATLLILTAIPWWRPLARPVLADVPAVDVAVSAPADLPIGDPVRGEALFNQSVAGLPTCATCHLIGDGRLVGPGLAGIAASAAGRVDGLSAEQYLYQSIMQPSAYVVSGFVDVMPASFATALTPQQAQDLVAYLLTLSD